MNDFKKNLDALCDSYELEIYALDATIQRVRKLVDVFNKGESDKVTYSGRLVANEIRRALDGGQ